jgi:dihydrofolate reductase
MKVILIAAIGKNNEIGLNNKLLWRSPSDLSSFKTITEGYPIIMGRKTFESLPGILPNRTHIIVTNKDKTLSVFNSADSVKSSILEAIKEASDFGSEKVFIIGGASIYKQALEQDLVDELIITHVDWSGYADTYIHFDKSIWKYSKDLQSYNGEVGPCWTQTLYKKGNK